MTEVTWTEADEVGAVNVHETKRKPRRKVKARGHEEVIVITEGDILGWLRESGRIK